MSLGKTIGIWGQELRACRLALERIADRFQDAERIARLEELLKDFVSTMENPRATDQDWTDLLADVKEALA